MYTDPSIVPRRKLYTGRSIPCIGMGTFGSDRCSAAQVSAAVSGAIRCGYRLFDCASVYGNEYSCGKAPGIGRASGMIVPYGHNNIIRTRKQTGV